LQQARQEAEANMTGLLQSTFVGVVRAQTLIENGGRWGVLSNFICQYNVDLLVVGTIRF
jgi:hypothetical protein